MLRLGYESVSKFLRASGLEEARIKWTSQIAVRVPVELSVVETLWSPPLRPTPHQGHTRLPLLLRQGHSGIPSPTTKARIAH